MRSCHVLVQEIKRPLLTNIFSIYKYLHTAITLPLDLSSLIRLMTTIHLIKIIFRHLDHFLWVLSPPLIPYLQSMSSRIKGTSEVRAPDLNSSSYLKQIFWLVLDIPFMDSPQTAYRSLITGFHE